MAMYHTGNPIGPDGSADPRDLHDNAKILDVRVNSREHEQYPDRLDETRWTWWGFEQRFNRWMENSGYVYMGQYAPDIVLTDYNQVVRDEDGNLWRLNPATVGPDELPYTTTGEGLPEGDAFIVAQDNSLREQLTGSLSDGNGALRIPGTVIGLESSDDLADIPRDAVADGQMFMIDGVIFTYDEATDQYVVASTFITPKAFGLKAQGDETALLQTFCQFANDNGLEIKWDGRRYEFSEMTLTGDTHWSGSAELYSNKTERTGDDYHSDWAIYFNNEPVQEYQGTQDLNIGDRFISLSSISDAESGDLLKVSSTRLIATDHRGGWTEGQIFRILSTGSGGVNVEDPSDFFSRATTVYSGNILEKLDNYTLRVSTLPNPLVAREVVLRITITSGAGAGEFRYITNYTAPDTVWHDSSRLPWPSTVQVGDTYNLEWVFSADLYKRRTLKIEGDITLRREISTTESGDNFSFRGCRVEGYDEPDIKLNVIGFAETGLHLRNCYKPFFHDSEASYANRIITIFNGTGYGCSVEVCHKALLQNIRGVQNRRTIDFSGSSGYSTHCRADNIVNKGGGVTYAGLPMWPQGDQQQTVAGSHGSGLYCTYNNCTGIDTYGVMVMRGRCEHVTNTYHYGYGGQTLNMNFGSGYIFDGVYYSDRFGEVQRGAGNRYEISSMPEKRLDHVAFIDFGDPYAGTMTNVIRNVHAESVVRAGVWCSSGAATTIMNLECSDWHITVQNEGSSETDFAFIRTGVSSTISDCYFDNINLREPFDYSGSVLPFALVTSVGAIPSLEVSAGSGATKGMFYYNGTWYCRVNSNGIKRIPWRGTGLTALVDIWNLRTGIDRPRCIATFVTDSSASDYTPVPNKVNVDLLASYPSGTGGTGAGNFGVNLSIQRGFLSVVNNTGGAQTFACRMH